MMKAKEVKELIQFLESKPTYRQFNARFNGRPLSTALLYAILVSKK